MRLGAIDLNTIVDNPRPGADIAIDAIIERDRSRRYARHTDAQRLRDVRTALSICRFVAHEPKTLAEIGAGLGFHPRTVRRYILALLDSGLDIIVTRGPYSANRYALDKRSWHGLLSLPPD